MVNCLLDLEGFCFCGSYMFNSSATGDNMSMQCSVGKKGTCLHEVFFLSVLIL